jgi:hypothetical protein
MTHRHGLSTGPCNPTFTIDAGIRFILRSLVPEVRS